MKTENQYISIMGFLYSGSSAVADYIKQFEGFGYMSKDETRFFVNGMSELYELKKKGKEPTKNQYEKIRRIFSGDFDESLYGFAGNMRINKKMFEGIDTKEAGKLVDKFLKEIKGDPVEMFILYAREFIDNFCSLKVSEKVRVFNNDPGAGLVDTTLLFKNSKAIIIYRDLCDQFLDQINHSVSLYKGQIVNLENAKIFIDMMNWKITLFLRDIEFIKKYDASRLDNIYIVSFEDFVKNKEIRNDIDIFLGLSNPGSKIFFPEKSIQNIGISENMDRKIRDYIINEVKINKIKL